MNNKTALGVHLLATNLLKMGFPKEQVQFVNHKHKCFECQKSIPTSGKLTGWFYKIFYKQVHSEKCQIKNGNVSPKCKCKVQLIDGILCPDCTNKQHGGKVNDIVKKKKQMISQFCDVCGKQSGMQCSLCKTIYYCSKECQKSDWIFHKEECKHCKPGTKKRIVEYFNSQTKFKVKHVKNAAACGLIRLGIKMDPHTLIAVHHTKTLGEYIWLPTNYYANAPSPTQLISWKKNLVTMFGFNGSYTWNEILYCGGCKQIVKKGKIFCQCVLLEDDKETKLIAIPRMKCYNCIMKNEQIILSKTLSEDFVTIWNQKIPTFLKEILIKLGQQIKNGKIEHVKYN